ncbi:hypothetical protein GCM10017783_08820 [Deinococcus piscis]|uniref:HAD superfamily Cof-like phosphohydrolase n=1 Tax=Deinococcus piscis TaxID=394230 RepID=A0ABQ3K4N4_9DEIO|nr:hypothetical protein [Deinococcus piscis]GHF99019.1 hypothetical protein GCM10017783_08820 [Deinococcus piscis]
MRDPDPALPPHPADFAAQPTSAQPAGAQPVNYTQALRQFHQAIGEPAPGRPALPSAELLQIRRMLLSEEWAEVQEELDLLQARLASGTVQPDAPAELHRLAHELTDLLYVTYGTLVQLGIDPDATFTAVHQANLGKVGGPLRSDGKLLKPEGWQPADVRGVLERLGRGTEGS